MRIACCAHVVWMYKAAVSWHEFHVWVLFQVSSYNFADQYTLRCWLQIWHWSLHCSIHLMQRFSIQSIKPHSIFNFNWDQEVTSANTTLRLGQEVELSFRASDELHQLYLNVGNTCSYSGQPSTLPFSIDNIHRPSGRVLSKKSSPKTHT